MLKNHTASEIESITQLLLEMVQETYVTPEQHAVAPTCTKEEMIAQFFETSAPSEGMGLEAALQMFRERVLPYSVRTWHPMFLNQMFPGTSFPAIAGDLLTSMLNPTLATYEMAPAGTVIERSVATWMAKILGMPEGSSGIFLPGGSISNLMAIAVARNTRLPQAARLGLAGLDTKGAILCSEASHYSISNASNLLGIGAEQVIKVRTNDRNEMLYEDLLACLDRCAARGLKPFVVVATMGITVTGGFDPLHLIAPLCKERRIHLHVDAAFGGGIALTTSGPEVLKGIELADTVIWDAHKWLHVPVATSVLLVPNPGVLKQVFSSNADYLFHPQADDLDLTEDLGHSTPLCGKRFDALKIWLMFKAYGEPYFRELAEERMTTTREIAAVLADDPDFSLSYEPRSPLVCFRYAPSALAEADGGYMDRLHRAVREACKHEGKMMFNVAQLKGRIHFRMILVNPLTFTSHLRDLLENVRVKAKAFVAANPAG